MWKRVLILFALTLPLPSIAAESVDGSCWAEIQLLDSDTLGVVAEGEFRQDFGFIPLPLLKSLTRRTCASGPALQNTVIGLCTANPLAHFVKLIARYEYTTLDGTDFGPFIATSKYSKHKKPTTPTREKLLITLRTCDFWRD